jgi:hypothetical protein
VSFGALFLPATPFDPTTVAGCTLYLRSDLGVTASGGNISSWADQSGNGRNATGSTTKPTVSGTTQNGIAGIDFGLSGTEFFTLASDPLGTGWTIFAVVKMGSSVAFQQVIYHSLFTGNSAYRGLRTSSTKHAQSIDFDGGTTALASDTATLAASTAYILAARDTANGSPVEAFTNADAGVSVTNAASSFTSSNFRIGCLTSGTNGFFGTLFALVIYSRALNSTEYAYVRDGLDGLFAVY